MSRARFLLRFDDITPAMNWAAWQEVERILRAADIRPILAVVPDNQDDALSVGPARADFWERVRGWQADGWTIGLHGYQHRLEPGDSGLVALNRFTEFAGMPRDVQSARLRGALEIFARERVTPDVWIAPAHAFDAVTLDLLREAGLTRISDGLFLHARVDRRGLTWVPQQLWALSQRPFGLWTVCYHVNGWTPADIARFERDVATFAPQIIEFEAACAEATGRRKSLFDDIFARAYLGGLLGMRFASRVRRSFRQ